jgi:hypothetical protein
MTYAIGADELTNQHILIGDAISPTRYSQGVQILATNDDLADTVLVLHAAGQIEYPSNSTVYVAR